MILRPTSRKIVHIGTYWPGTCVAGMNKATVVNHLDEMGDRSRESTAVAPGSFRSATCFRSALEYSDSPNFDAHDFEVDFREWVDTLRSTVLGALSTVRRKSDPLEVRALSVQDVASAFIRVLSSWGHHLLVFRYSAGIS